MLSKFSIDYIVQPQHNVRVFTHYTDDPVEVEDFLMHLLVSRTRIVAIRHDSVALTGHQFDKLLKNAAERIASTLLRESLSLDAELVKLRFGFAA
ncbi:hypothetical protein IMCC26134_07770 [Verrucomicrobia bacterium IMCC26134]|jgi:hypothetical protein|nr:hypothetical protein IMCC26134_07770 [Verrucomicrobia bacterium IMCC26134]